MNPSKRPVVPLVEIVGLPQTTMATKLIRQRVGGFGLLGGVKKIIFAEMPWKGLRGFNFRGIVAFLLNLQL